MREIIDIKQKDIAIDRNDILKILNYEKEDIIFLSGSLIEGSINELSKGMGNRLSDIDVFILADDINKIHELSVDYDWDCLKIQFKRLYGISFDIEIYSKQVFLELMQQLSEYKFDDDTRTLNILKLPANIGLLKFTSFVHRLLNGIPIYNDEKFDEIKHNFNQGNYYKLMTRESLNKVDLNYEDVCGNLENGQLEVAAYIARGILIETMKAYIFYKRTSLDRDKWIPLKLKNLAQCDKRSAIIYDKFKKLYFEQKLDGEESLRTNAERILDFSNDVINEIGQGGAI
jgi:hypothetical protein